MLKILLDLNEVNPNRRDNGGPTPHMCEARHGHHRVIELLQPHEEVTRGTPSGLGDTTPYKPSLPCILSQSALLMEAILGPLLQRRASRMTSPHIQ